MESYDAFFGVLTKTDLQYQCDKCIQKRRGRGRRRRRKFSHGNLCCVPNIEHNTEVPVY
jgi:hypothetical protein